MNPAIRENGVSYWLALSRTTVAYYVRQRRWTALLRAAWLTIVRGYFGEVCQVCGRKIGIIWHADDSLYRLATGSSSGIYCPACFDTLASAATGSYIRWRPTTCPR